MTTTARTRPTTTPGSIRPGLLLDVSSCGRTATVRLFGVVDLLTARRIRAVAGMGSVVTARFVTLDIERATVADVAGWRALRDLTADLVDRGATVTQVGARGRDQRLHDLLLHLDQRRPRPVAPTAA
jgi:hypothetical protein